MKIVVGKTYKLDLTQYDNTSGWITLAHKERAYKNCHQQAVEIIKPYKNKPGRYWAKLITGPLASTDLGKIVIEASWISGFLKIPCDCPLKVVMAKGCQNKSLHE